MDNKNENREVAIQLSGVKKMYKLGQIGGGTLEEDLQSWWARVRGKEDPNVKIGKERLIGKTFMALNGIDLTIYKGEALGIIGANGAGKSTMLKLLSRVTAPTEGEIDIYGRVASMLEVGTGFSKEMTGRENIYMNGAILGMTKAEIDAKMEDIIEFSEVRDFIDTPVKRYSSGMYVKLAFSVAAHLDNEIMIMDEVLAVGDMAFQKKCLNKMREAASKEGRTVLYVSHNMNTIRQLCERCIVLDQGKIVFDGDVEEAIEVYLESYNQEDGLVIQLSEYKREKFVVGSATLKRFEFLNTENKVYIKGERVRFRIDWHSKDDLTDVFLRLIIRNQTDVPVCSILSDYFELIKKEEEKSASFEFDTSLLVSGKYYISISLLQKDNFGNRKTVDHLPRICSFDIIDDVNSLNKLKWDYRSWGSILLPDLTRID